MTEPARVRCVIAGTVQGVGFRAAARRAAQDFGCVGGVRNLPDGRVELVAEGEPARVDALVAWCRRGPLGAVVTDVAVTREVVRGEGPGFEIRR